MYNLLEDDKYNGEKYTRKECWGKRRGSGLPGLGHKRSHWKCDSGARILRRWQNDPCDCLGEKLHRQQVKVWLACWSCTEEPIEDRAGVTLCCGSVHALMTLITQGERTYNMFISPQFQEKKLVFNVCLLEV